MGLNPGSDQFYEQVPVFRDFSGIADPTQYRALPDDWWLGVADVVQSTQAIRDNRYKAVNMAGASVIAGVANALQVRDFPFVFGGDGASFAVPPAAKDIAGEAMAATAAWVRDELSLTLRVALVPVKAVRTHGVDVRVGRFGPSGDVAYAMFSGGGLAWADAAMKRGEYAIEPGPAGARPDLSGLSCRFAEIPARRGVILSFLVVPVAGVSDAAFHALIDEVTRFVETSPDASRPVPDGGPALRWPPPGLDIEARATRRAGGSLATRQLVLTAYTALVYVILRWRIRVGSFVPSRYLKELVQNTDFRKYDDGLRMVLDCTPAFADELEARLSRAASAGIARFGHHRQNAAMLTCFTPLPIRQDHVHFVDGAHGGYAMAASVLKASQDVSR